MLQHSFVLNLVYLLPVSVLIYCTCSELEYAIEWTASAVSLPENIYRNTGTEVSQRGDSPFVYRDGTGRPASLPYIRKIHVSVAIGTQSGIRPAPMVKIWGSSKNDQNWITGKLLKL